MNTDSKKFQLAAFDLLVDLKALDFFVKALAKSQQNLISAKGVIKIDNKGTRLIKGRSVLKYFLEASVYNSYVYEYVTTKVHPTQVYTPPDVIWYGPTPVYVETGSDTIEERVERFVERIEERNLLQLVTNISKVSRLSAEKIFAYADHLLETAPKENG